MVVRKEGRGTYKTTFVDGGKRNNGWSGSARRRVHAVARSRGRNQPFKIQDSKLGLRLPILHLAITSVHLLEKFCITFFLERETDPKTAGQFFHRKRTNPSVTALNLRCPKSLKSLLLT